MADPFFSTGNNVNPSNNTNTGADNQNKINLLQSQQKQLEKDFLSLNESLKNQQLSNEQKIQVQQKMQQLDFQYKQNLNVLKSLGVGQGGVVKQNAVSTKSGSKISMKQFFVGCAVLFMMVVGGLAAMFYYFISNPAQLSSVGLAPQTAKMLLQAFIGVFFGLLFLIGFALVIVNLYRLITVKNKSKIGYIFGLIFGFIIFIFSIALGSTFLSKISAISVDNLKDPNKLLMPYLQMKDGPVYVGSENNFKLIAPGIINFNLNSNLFNSQIMPKIGQVQLQGVELDCGNGQKLNMDIKTAKFQSACIYYKKGNYPLMINISYLNPQTSEKLNKSFEAGNLDFKSEIKITNKDNSVLNVPLDVIVGKVPAKVMFDASSVFKDFSLNEYKVVWDVDGDGNPDKSDVSSFSYVYKEAKVYHVGIRFPGLNNYLYSFPIRVEQSDVPVCEIKVTQIKGTEYAFTTNFLDSKAIISDYSFDVFDNNNSKKIDTFKNKKGYFNYAFSSKGNYSIIATFLTDEGKKGECESEDIEVGAVSFDINYDLYYKSPGSPEFKKIDKNQSTIFKDGTLTLDEIPTVLKIDITNINPDTPSTSKKVLLDDKPVLSSDNKSFEITLDENKNYTIKIVVEDTNRNMKTEQTIPVNIKMNDIIGKLIISPDTVGIEPFTVKFDASTTVINDPSDEIVYFTWDFADGEIKKNISQSVMSHTYKYDNQKENGEYFPVITIKTKKGREIIIGSGTRIIVKKPIINLKINIPSHPAQLAKVGDKVDFSLELNGLPTSIKWDFGDGKTLECKTRQECADTSNVFEKAGTYTIKASVTFDNQPSIEGNITLIVKT